MPDPRYKKKQKKLTGEEEHRIWKNQWDRYKRARDNGHLAYKKKLGVAQKAIGSLVSNIQPLTHMDNMGWNIDGRKASFIPKPSDPNFRQVSKRLSIMSNAIQNAVDKYDGNGKLFETAAVKKEILRAVLFGVYDTAKLPKAIDEALPNNFKNTTFTDIISHEKPFGKDRTSDTAMERTIKQDILLEYLSQLSLSQQLFNDKFEAGKKTGIDFKRDLGAANSRLNNLLGENVNDYMFTEMVDYYKRNNMLSAEREATLVNIFYNLARKDPDAPRMNYNNVKDIIKSINDFGYFPRVKVDVIQFDKSVKGTGRVDALAERSAASHIIRELSKNDMYIDEGYQFFSSKSKQNGIPGDHARVLLQKAILTSAIGPYVAIESVEYFSCASERL